MCVIRRVPTACIREKVFQAKKKQNLCKPFTVTTTDGFIVNIPGPYEDTKNDTQIMKLDFQNPDSIRKLLRKILDCGFRDVVPYLDEQGFKVLMLALKGKRSKLTTKESNFSRFVTKVRWVVESDHGRIGKKWKISYNQVDNKLLPKIRVIICLVCFLINMFGEKFFSDQELQAEIVARMLRMKNVVDRFATEVEEGSWKWKKLSFKPLSSNDLLQFSRNKPE